MSTSQPTPQSAPQSGSRKAGAKSSKRAPAGTGPDGVLRDLIGGGHTALSASKALRARDLLRPSTEDLEAAEREVRIVRRNWAPEK